MFQTATCERAAEHETRHVRTGKRIFSPPALQRAVTGRRQLRFSRHRRRAHVEDYVHRLNHINNKAPLHLVGGGLF